MPVAAAISVISDNVALWIDPIRTRTSRQRSRYVDVCKFAFAQQKTMRADPHNFALRVDPLRCRKCRPG